MWDLFLNLLALAGIFPLLIGMMTVFSWGLPIKPPADTSNRFNRVRLWWFGVSAPHRFADAFPWMKGDEVDNMGRFWEKSQDD